MLIVLDASSQWSSRQGAREVATEATQLQMVAHARVELVDAVTPLTAVSYARGLGIDPTTVSRLLNIDLSHAVGQAKSTIERDPTFRSTSTLRADSAALLIEFPRVPIGAVSYARFVTQSDDFLADLVNLWDADYRTLQAGVASWQPPGGFEQEIAALRQTYEAFVQGGDAVQGEINVMTGQGGLAAKEELVESDNAYTIATEQFVGYLGPKGQAAWTSLHNSSAVQKYQATLQEAVTVALRNQTAPWAADPALAGPAMTAGLTFLGGLDALVSADSADVHDAASAHASAATRSLVQELVLLGLLAGISLGGVIIGGRWLGRPLERLAEAAQKVSTGEFDLTPLSDGGPREVVMTNEAFNDMASTLKALEAKAVALAAEDLTHPEIQVPLPGRTGRALQATVDQLTARIGERQRQHHALLELATHDRLTGLLNRAAILDVLTHDVAERRRMGEAVAVLFIDLDGLKLLNDTHGHDAGDQAIVATAEAVAETIGEYGMVGRLGGDEFLVVLSGEERRAVGSVVERIRQAVAARTVSTDGMNIPLRCSIGVAFADHGSDIDPMELVRQADAAMYDAKRAYHGSAEQAAALAQQHAGQAPT